MQHSKSQLNAIYYFYRDRAERRRNAFNALYSWVNPGDLFVINRLKSFAEDGSCGEFVRAYNSFREARHTINWAAVGGGYRWAWHYAAFERYRAAVRAQKSPYYRSRLAKLGIDWKAVKMPYGTEAIELD